MSSDQPLDLDPEKLHENEVASLVRKVEADAARRDELWKAPTRPPRATPFRLVLLAAVLLVNAYVWIVQPAWLMGDGRPATPEAREEALRSRMYVQAQRIVAHSRESGTPPASLDDAGSPVAGLTYIVTGPDSWELRGETDGRELVLSSSDRLGGFLAGR